MYLSKLEIVGFKSFPRRTVLHFGKGISAIVGPNGCGKSNIFDAIRWVIGEQRPSVLRSDRMSDVIFKGTASRKPLSYAEVTIHLSEAKGGVPVVSGDELALTRRFFRSGEGEYLINGIPARLKDVNNLLLDSGIGRRSYSIIELDMVRRMISGDKNERRSILEEAAGISKYRSDIHEAQIKLADTEGKIERIRDIMLEVEERANILRKQVRRAKRFRKLKQKIADLELKILAIEYRELSSHIGKLEDSLSSFVDKVSSLDSRISSIEAEISSASSDRIKLEKEVVEQGELIRQTEKSIRELESEIVRTEERQKSTEKTIERLEGEIVSLQEKRRKTSFELTKTKRQKATIEKRIQELTEKVASVREHLGELDTSLADGRKNLSAMEKRIWQLTSKMDSVKEAILSTQKERELVDARLATLESQLRLIGTEIEKCTDDTEKTKAKIDELTLTIQTLSDRLEKRRQRKGELSSVIEEVRAEKSEVALKAKEIETRLSVITKSIEDYEGYTEGVKRVLEEKDNLPGVHGTIADMLNVDPEVVGGVERVLGERLQYIVVDSRENAIEIMDTLPEKLDLGFIILDELPKQSSSLDPVVACRVSCPDFPNLVQYLFADVEFVALLDSSNPDERLAVTYAGDGISSLGLLYSGRPKASKLGLIERRIIRDRLKEERDKVLLSLKLLEKREASLLADSAEEKKRISELRAKIEQTVSEVAEFEKQLASLVFRSRELSEKQRSLLEQKEEAKASIEKLASREGRLAREMEELDARFGKLDAEFEDKSNLQHKMEEERKRVASTLALGENELVRLHSDLVSLDRELERMNLFLADYRSNLERLEESRKESKAMLSAQGRALVRLRKKLDALFDKRDSEEAKLDKLRERLSSVVSKIDQLDSKLSPLRKEKEQSLARKSEIEALLGEEKKKLESILLKARREYKADADTLLSMKIDEKDKKKIESAIARYRRQAEEIGGINFEAEAEYEQASQRLSFYKEQYNDLVEAKRKLAGTIKSLDNEARKLFLKTFLKARENFGVTFRELFVGGEADLVLTNESDILESDIKIVIKPRGKRPLPLSQFSAGEQTLATLALLFGIYLIKPSPFCLLDEVDAPLDEANIGRFTAMIKKFSTDTQFIIITHQRKTMEVSEYLYGVSMEEEGVSKVITLRMEDLKLGL
ncbi:chromosome segregation protein SMC [bacterium]|nr:chromosome segregation protein SMC [bacterium]